MAYTGTSLSFGGILAAVVNGAGISYLLTRDGRGGAAGAGLVMDILGGIMVFGMASVTENLLSGEQGAGSHRLFYHRINKHDESKLDIQWTSWLEGGLINGLAILLLDAIGFTPGARFGGASVVVGGFVYIIARSTYADEGAFQKKA